MSNNENTFTTTTVETKETKALSSPSKSLCPRPSASLNTKRSLEESLDVFASTSSEAENSKLSPPSPPPPPKESVIDLSISDDSDGTDDRRLVAATDNVCDKKTPSKTLQTSEKSSDKSPTATTTPTKKALPPGLAKPRQRTLLEMLDQTYNQITGPATKRYCVNKSPQQKEKLQKE